MIKETPAWYQNSGAKTIIPNDVTERPWTKPMRKAVGLMLEAGIPGMDQRREFSRELVAHGVMVTRSRKKAADFLGVDYHWLRDRWAEWLIEQRERRRKK